MSKEPVRIGAAVTGIVTALLALLIAFGVEITGAQQQAITGIVGAVIALATAFGVGEIVRARVSPVNADE